jgi:hypothetical protein
MSQLAMLQLNDRMGVKLGEGKRAMEQQVFLFSLIIEGTTEKGVAIYNAT